MTSGLIFGERSLTKVAALFKDADSARAAQMELRGTSDMSDAQIRVVAPNDPGFELKLEPESVGVRKSMVHAHVFFGVVGLLCGVLLALILHAAKIAAVLAGPIATVMACTAFGTVFGLMVGGFVAARPDHDAMIERVRSGLHEGRWAVVTHPMNAEQERDALRAFHTVHAEVVRTL
ncbi:hypothetical protein [Niveibacterium sp. SC-1]|uniref:hypothetical protein n=1 Tax=Niveibacterium sp. SC-1 TaxID=3135646 RepID=UPI00311D5BDD